MCDDGDEMAGSLVGRVTSDRNARKYRGIHCPSYLWEWTRPVALLVVAVMTTAGGGDEGGVSCSGWCP